MSIRPVDYQILMPKVNELAKIQNEAQQKLTGQAHQQAENAAKSANRNTEIVHSQKEAQKSVIADKQKDRNGNEQKKGKPKGKEGENEADSELVEKRIQRHTIDIRL